MQYTIHGWLSEHFIHTAVVTSSVRQTAPILRRSRHVHAFTYTRRDLVLTDGVINRTA